MVWPVASKVMGWILDLLYPPKCIFCRKLIDAEQEDICNDCRLILPIFDESIASGTYIDWTCAVFFYENSIRDSLLRFKFHAMGQYAHIYGNLMATAVSAKSATKYDAITWIPISKKRRRKRGYDQSKLLAAEIATCLNLPLVETLVKKRDNPAQSMQTTQEGRKANVLGVYDCADKTAVDGKSLLLIDDIWTTGSTANEAARILLTAGAAQIDCAVLAAVRER